MSQLDSKGYRDTMRRLRQEDERARIEEARREGRPVSQGPQTPEELEHLERFSRRDRADDLSADERAALDGELRKALETIPEEYRGRFM